MIDNISPVDHFPGVIKHFSNVRLADLTAHYRRLTRDGSHDEFLHDRLTQCLQEFERRGTLIPWLRRRQSRLIA